jgi:hypothetical protein
MGAAEWARQKVESIQETKKADEVRAALNLERQTIRRANFPDLVQEVTEAFQSYCEEYNRHRLAGDRSLHYHVASGTLSLLKRDAGLSEMQVQVNFSVCAIRVTAHNCSFQYVRTYRPEALDDGSAMLSHSGSGHLVTPDDVAREAMDTFLDGRELAERL